jgi:RNA polymerase sigma-70 factor, ECF subfamily
VAGVATIDRIAGTVGSPASADEHAELLYERLYDRVYGYCLYRLGSREEAEDAAQVTFFQALRGLRRGVVPRVETAWVFAIAKNVCLERHQSRGRRRNREVLLDPATLESAPAEEDRQSEDVARLREALTHLPEHQREAVLLREWRGLSYREIATELGLSLSAVETLIFRARRSLAQQLTDEPDAKRTQLARGLVLGPLAAALKGALGGSAAKLAAAAAALVAATLTGGALVAGGGSADAPRRTAVVQPAVQPAVVPAADEPVFLRPVAAASHAPKAAPPPAERAPRPSGRPPGAATDDPEPGPLGAVGKKTDKLLGGNALEPVVEPLEPVLEPVQPVVEQVQSTLEPVLQTAPQLPEIELPALELP